MFKKILLFIFILNSLVFGAENAYAWGYGDLMVETLKVVKYIFSINEFQDVWKLAMIISMTVGTVAMMTPQTDYFKLPKIIIISTGIWTIFTTATIDIYVDDKADNSKSGLVTQVPWAVGYPVALFTTLEYRLGDMYETATSIPNGMKYSDSGFFTPISIFSKATQHKIINPTLSDNLNNYIIECVMPDLENGYKDYVNITKTDNLWAYMGNTSPATFAMYTNDDNSTTLLTCVEFYTSLNTEIKNYVGIGGEGMSNLGSGLGIVSSAAIATQLGVANQFLVNSSKTASDMLLQNTAINSFSDSFRNYVSLNQADLGSMSFHGGSAESQAQAQMIISGILGSKYIPLIKGILTVIVIGLTPLMALLMITPIGFKTILGYIMMLFWLSCWHFGDAILNHIIITKAQGDMTRFGDATMATKGLIDSTAIDYINMASSMYWAIPTIALVIATGFSLTALSSLNSSISTQLNRTSSTAGGEAGKGNVGFGNVSHGSYSANSSNSTRSSAFGNSMNYNNDAFKYDSSNTASSGNSRSNYNDKMDGNMDTKASGGWNTTLNDAMGGAGTGFSADSTKGQMQSLGGGLYSAGGATMTNSKTGEVTQAGNDAVLKKGMDGNFIPYSGQYETMTKDSNGDNLKIATDFNNGNEAKRTATNQAGDTMAITQNTDGTKNFNWKSGQDSGTTAAGIWNPMDIHKPINITSAKVDGVDMIGSKSGSQTFSASTANRTSNDLTDSWSKGMTEEEKLAKVKQSTEGLKTSADGKLQFSSSDQLAGFLLAKGTGVSASAGMGLGLQYSNDGSLSFQTADGKTQNISLSGSAKQSFDNSLQKNMSDEERKSAQLNLMMGEVDKKVNNDILNKGMTISDSLSGLVKNKSGLYSDVSNGVGAGAVSQVQNGPNHQGINNQNKGIEDSQYYDKKHQEADVKMKQNAIKLNNDGEKTYYKGEYKDGEKEKASINKKIEDRSIYDGSDDSKKALEKLNNQYEKSKNEGISGYAVDSLGQKIENLGMTSNAVGTAMVDKIKDFGQSQDVNKSIDAVNSEYSLNGKTVNPDGDRTQNWHDNNLPKYNNTTSRDLVYDLENKNAVEYNRFGDSSIKDWSKIESLPKSEIEKLSNFNDWDKATTNRLNQLKGDGDFKIEPGNKGLEDATKMMNINQNQPKQKVEEVNDRK